MYGSRFGVPLPSLFPSFTSLNLKTLGRSELFFLSLLFHTCLGSIYASMVDATNFVRPFFCSSSIIIRRLASRTEFGLERTVYSVPRSSIPSMPTACGVHTWLLIKSLPCFRNFNIENRKIYSLHTDIDMYHANRRPFRRRHQHRSLRYCYNY